MRQKTSQAPSQVLVEDSMVTRKGQITVPAAIRRELKLKRGDRVTFLVEDDHTVRLQRGSNPVSRTKGAVKDPYPHLSAELLRSTTEQLIAEDVIRRSGG